MSGKKIQHTTYTSLYKDSSSDLMGMNNDVSEVEKIAEYTYPWRTTDGPHTVTELEQIVCDNFADHNTIAIGV